MSKPYTEEDFSSQISQDRTWRIREISDLKSAIGRADANLQRVLLRALVAICYAHWEGYVRFAARKFLEHIALRGILYSRLDRQFLRNYFLPRLAALSTSRVSLADRCDLIDEILACDSSSYRRVNVDLVNTKSNLSYEVFKDICLVCGVDGNQFSGRTTLIDVLLLKRRNAIAHGEETFVSADDLEVISNGTIEMMRAFGDQLENRIVLKTYLSR